MKTCTTVTAYSEHMICNRNYRECQWKGPKCSLERFSANNKFYVYTIILCMRGSCMQLVALWSVLVRASACPMESSLSTLRAARGVFVAMDRPLSVSKQSAWLCNELPKAAPIRGGATTTETNFR